MKSCTNCRAEKPAEAFYRNPLTRDGLGSWCKECDRARNRTRYTKSYRKTSGYAVAQAKYRGSEKSRENSRRYLSENRGERVLAREAVNAAIRHGRMTRPDRCVSCGTGCVPHGHHDDYSKPLAVRWLCPPCHTAAHGRAVAITYSETTALSLGAATKEG